MKTLRNTLAVLLLVGAAVSGHAEAVAQVGTEGKDQGVVSKSAARKEVARILHEQIIKRFTAYEDVRQHTKALAGCINWDRSTPDYVNLIDLRASVTGDTSDREFFPGQLMRKAMNTCDKFRKKNNLDCKCVKIDISGQNILKVPDSVVEMYMKK